MTDGQFLLLVFTLLYLYECLRWVPGRAVIWSLFGSATDPKAWRSGSPLQLFRTRGGAFALLPPVPPIAAHVMAASWPAVPHSQGLCVWDEATGVTSHIPWDDVHAAADEATLKVTAGHQVRCVHGWQAAEWAKLIQGWKTLPQEEREVQFLAKAATLLNREALLEAGRRVAKETRGLRWNGTVIFVWTLLVLPYTYWRFADTLPTLIAFAAVYVLMLWQAGCLWALSRREPRLKHGRWSHILGAAFYPPSSIRAADWVCVMRCPEVHPLASAFAWGSKESAEKLAAQIWRLARWPVGSFDQRPWSGPEVQALEAFFKTLELDLSSLAVAPDLPEGANRHCPRCLATYASTAETCPDCGGMPLIVRQTPSVEASAVA
jgi:hypothetical protein